MKKHWLVAVLLSAVLCAGLAAEEDGATGRRPDIGFVPTPQAAVERMVELADIKPGDKVYDLGCGDGRIVIAAARRHGVRATGIEIDPGCVRASRENARTAGVEKLVEIRQEDIFKSDFSDADVVFLYLLPALNERLMPQLSKLKRGARIIAFDFAMGDAKPVLVERGKFDGFASHTIYKWIVPWEQGSGGTWDIFTTTP
ncbi:MAG: methyltransferase domain-containing protein [Chthoniobacterales bacterium]|nr:methyltransferase domain-containing protein [Chthoniobacterales bacterium]